MARVTEYTREGGTHHIQPRKPKGRGMSEPKQEEKADADDTRGNRGED